MQARIGAAQQRLWRTIAALVILCVIALALQRLPVSTMTRVMGFSLAFPGAGSWPLIFDDGGALCLSAPLGFVAALASGLSIVAFAMAVVMWFGAGGVIFPPLVWALSGAIAIWLTPNVPIEMPLTLSIGSIAPWGVLIAILLWPTRRRAAPPPYAARVAAPKQFINADIAHRFNFALDRALQPIEEFNGFQFVDQFQTAATRYQICKLGFALSGLQSRLPAFRGYLAQAQNNLVTKQLDARIWRYWRYENAWGNLRLNPDPVARDNIMYGGFVAAQIAMIEKLTADKRFSERGTLILSDGKNTYEYDQPQLIDALYRGWDRSPLGLMACEPNWVYPLCNAIGASAAMSQDAPRWSAIRSNFCENLNANLLGADGLPVPFKSTLTGISAPPVGGAVVAAYPILFWNIIFPDLAADYWARVREKYLPLNKTKFWKVDTGDYRLSRAASLAGFAAAAAEMGDLEARDQALTMLETECPSAQTSHWHRPNGSVFAHALELMARVNDGGLYQGIFAGAPADALATYLDFRDYNKAAVIAAQLHENQLHFTLYAPKSTPLSIPIYHQGPQKTLHWRNQSGQSGIITVGADNIGTFDVLVTGTENFEVTFQ